MIPQHTGKSMPEDSGAQRGKLHAAQTLPHTDHPMGSRALFLPERCHRCERLTVAPCYPTWPDVCPSCEVNDRSPHVANLLKHILRREPPTDMVATVTNFCATYRTTGWRLHFLHCVLLSRDSCFRRFTFSGGGNISPTEDVLDRIMSYLG